MTALRAVVVMPLSGPLARFGSAGVAALQLWAMRALALSPPWTTVDLQVIDPYPSVGAGMRSAVVGRADIVFGPYGAGPAVAALKATARAVWNHGGATARLVRPAFPNAINVMAPAATYFDRVLRALLHSDPGIGRVALLHSTTGFGQEVAGGAAAACSELGLDLSATPYAPGQVAVGAADLAAGDVLLVAGAFDDELEAARLLLGRPWRAAAFVGAGVDEVLAALGSAREGLLGPAQWLARVAEPPDEGPDAAWFATAFHEATGAEPSYPAAAAFSAGVLAARTLREAGTVDDAGVLKAAFGLRARTAFGDFRLDPKTGLQVGHDILVVQWQAGVRRVVWPLSKAERPILPFSAR